MRAKFKGEAEPSLYVAPLRVDWSELVRVDALEGGVGGQEGAGIEGASGHSPARQQRRDRVRDAVGHVLLATSDEALVFLVFCLPSELVGRHEAGGRAAAKDKRDGGNHVLKVCKPAMSKQESHESLESLCWWLTFRLVEAVGGENHVHGLEHLQCALRDQHVAPVEREELDDALQTVELDVGLGVPLRVCCVGSVCEVHLAQGQVK